MGGNFSLPSLGADSNTSIVAGFSCGAYMATNLNVIHSDTFKGAGMISGGPYLAEKYYPFGGLDMHFFSDYERNSDYVTPLVTADAQQFSNDGLIDPIDNLKNMPIYILSNTLD